MLLRSLLLVTVVVIPGVAQQPAFLFTGGRIWTGDPNQSAAEAVVVQGERITFVGTAAAARTLAGPAARTVDLQGRLLLPGMIDSHVHFLSGGDELLAPDLRSAGSADLMAARLGAAAKTLPQGSWLTSGSWDHENWPGAPLPTRQDLDRHVPDHPVFVSRLDGHMAVANSLAIRIARVTADTPDPPGGTIVRDPATGEPQGVFKDAAMALVNAHVPAWNREQRLQRARSALRHAAELGVTSVHDMLDSWAPLETYQELRRNRELTCRIALYLPIADVGRLAAVRLQRGFGDDWLAINGCKGFADGSLGSTTAWFREPYADAPRTCGLPMPELQDGTMQERLGQLAHLQLQPAIHAIGDRANRTVLDQLAAVTGMAALRPRIEHAQHLQREDLPRFAALGVIASMQPYHAIDDGRWAEKRIGQERCETTYAFAALLAEGATLAFGSDWPVAPLSPWWGLQAAVTRATLDGAHPEGWVPAQKITLEQALTAYTRGAAFAGFAEDRLGMLRVGYLADLVVLDRDPFAVPTAALHELRPVLTMVGGRVVFERR